MLDADSDSKTLQNSATFTPNDILNCLSQNNFLNSNQLDLENINPLGFMSATQNTGSFLNTQSNNMFMSNQEFQPQIQTECDSQHDELLLSNHQIVLEKCLLEILDDMLLDDGPSTKSANNENNKKEVLKSVNINTLNNNNSPKKHLSTKNNYKTSSSCSSPISDINSSSSLNNNSRSISTSGSTSSLMLKNNQSSIGQHLSSSIQLFRSINSSNTIFVQPTDIIIPLSDGDYNEYKLFPAHEEAIIDEHSKQQQDDECSYLMDKIMDNLGLYSKNSCMNSEYPGVYSPALSPLSSISSSNNNSNASSPVSSPPPSHHHRHFHHHHHHQQLNIY
jgi:hypothetical protein